MKLDRNELLLIYTLVLDKVLDTLYELNVFIMNVFKSSCLISIHLVIHFCDMFYQSDFYNYIKAMYNVLEI